MLVEVPTAAAQSDEAALVVHAMGCHGPGASVSAKAEGLVNGQRVSQPVKLKPLGGDRYALRRQWPIQGTWLVSLNAKSQHSVRFGKRTIRPVDNVLVEFAPDGTVKSMYQAPAPANGEAKQCARTRRVSSKGKAQAIHAALQTLAAQAAPASSITTG